MKSIITIFACVWIMLANAQTTQAVSYRKALRYNNDSIQLVTIKTITITTLTSTAPESDSGFVKKGRLSDQKSIVQEFVYERTDSSFYISNSDLYENGNNIDLAYAQPNIAIEQRMVPRTKFYRSFLYEQTIGEYTYVKFNSDKKIFEFFKDYRVIEDKFAWGKLLIFLVIILWSIGYSIDKLVRVGEDFSFQYAVGITVIMYLVTSLFFMCIYDWDYIYRPSSVDRVTAVVVRIAFIYTVVYRSLKTRSKAKTKH